MKAISSCVGGLLLCAALCLAARAADTAPSCAGTWSLNNWSPGDSLRLSLSYSNATTRWRWGNDQRIADLRGLTSERLHSVHASVAFTLQRDAGTFNFEGTLMLGVGRGAYRFVPDPTYAAKLSALGYTKIGNDPVSIMLMAVRDISLAYASEVKQSGLKDVAISDLVRLLDHGVGADLLRALPAAGYTDLTADDVVRLQDHGIDDGFLRALKASGALALSAGDVVKLHDHGVRPDYLARVRVAGYGDLTVEQIIRLHDHGVD
jgi:hypothetical protein